MLSRSATTRVIQPALVCAALVCLLGLRERHEMREMAIAQGIKV